MYKVLIVDDEAIERDALRYIIEKSELPVTAIEEAVNGQEAIAVTAVFEPDIIFMDIKMPGLDGIESSKIIRKVKEDAKIIFQTAFDELDHAKAGIELGVEAFLVKPASKEQVIQALADTIDALEKEHRQKETREQIEEKLEQMSVYLEEEFLSSVIAGELNGHQLAEYRAFMDISQQYGFGVEIVLHYGDRDLSSDLRRQMLKKRVMENLKGRLSGTRHKVFLSSRKEAIQVLVMSLSQEDAFEGQDEVKRIILDLGEKVQSEHQINTDFGIGDVKDNPEELWQSFAAARKATKKKVSAQGSNQAIELMPQLVRCMMDCDEEAVTKRTDLIFDALSEGVEDMSVLKVKIYEFLVMFSQSVRSEISIEMESAETQFSKVMALKTVGAAKAYIRDRIHNISKGIMEMKSDRTVVIMDNLITYINAHYGENINLEQLGAISGFSSFYLSKIFKKHVDMNFSDYLTFIRIKVAKRLLKNPSKSIKEISMEVGYPDPNYFARVFRKMEQVTPTEYRNLHMTHE